MASLVDDLCRPSLTLPRWTRRTVAMQVGATMPFSQPEPGHISRRHNFQKISPQTTVWMRVQWAQPCIHIMDNERDTDVTRCKHQVLLSGALKTLETSLFRSRYLLSVEIPTGHCQDTRCCARPLCRVLLSGPAPAFDRTATQIVCELMEQTSAFPSVWTRHRISVLPSFQEIRMRKHLSSAVLALLLATGLSLAASPATADDIKVTLSGSQPSSPTAPPSSWSLPC